jgi:hypothetical protein
MVANKYSTIQGVANGQDTDTEYCYYSKQIS